MSAAIDSTAVSPVLETSSEHITAPVPENVIPSASNVSNETSSNSKPQSASSGNVTGESDTNIPEEVADEPCPQDASSEEEPDPISFKDRKNSQAYRKKLLAALHLAMQSIISDITAIMISRRITCLILLLADPDDIAHACEFSFLKKSTVYSLRSRLFNLKRPADIISLLEDKEGRGPQNPLNSIASDVINILETRNLHTLQEIIDEIKNVTKVTCSRKCLSSFLAAHGYRRLKCGSIPAKADVEAQARFYENELKPLMDRAEKGEIKLFFVDASHFVYGGDYLGYVYCKRRRFMKTSTGRKRYNVLGALDYCDKKIITVTDETHINANVVRSLLKKLHDNYPEKEIYVVLDNARYQHCDYVVDYMKELKINYRFLVTYSPNLNLIERAWGFVKRELRKAVYSDYDTFCKKIDKLIESTTGDNKEKFKSLIGQKIQLFNGYSIIDENTFSSPDRRKNNNEAA